MRLAQLARKVKLPPTEIKRFLESEFDLTIGKDPNFKLEDIHVAAILEKFPIPVEEKPAPVMAKKVVEKDPTPEPQEEENTAEAVVSKVEEIETPVETSPEEIEPTETPETREEIETTANNETEENEDLSATAEEIEVPQEVEGTAETGEENIEEEEPDFDPYEEQPVDPEAELIKAPKVKLDGLKILGKIELPEKSVEAEPEKTTEELEAEEASKIAELDAAMQSQAQDIKKRPQKNKKTETRVEDDSEEDSLYKDKKGNYRFTAEQRANRVKRLAELAEKKRLESIKERKKKHYETIMKDRQVPVAEKELKVKQKKTEKTLQKKKEKAEPQPTSLWGRFMRWLND